MIERQRNLKRFKVRIYCADKECSSKNRTNPIEITDILLLIGESFKCPYCRGYTFILCPDKNRKEK